MQITPREIIEDRLRWFTHVRHRVPNVPISRCNNMMIGVIERQQSKPKNHIGGKLLRKICIMKPTISKT